MCRGTRYYPDTQGNAVRSTTDMQVFWKEVVGTGTVLVFSICSPIIQAIPKRIPCLPAVVAVGSSQVFWHSFASCKFNTLSGLKWSLQGMQNFLSHVYSFKWKNWLQRSLRAARSACEIKMEYYQEILRASFCFITVSLRKTEYGIYDVLIMCLSGFITCCVLGCLSQNTWNTYWKLSCLDCSLLPFG